jgi:hypothetical protein
MSLEDLNLDNGESISPNAEAPSEKSEKQKEASRRAQSQLQKTQKDEKKAKQDNNDLFQLLSRFIQNPLYEELIPDVVILLQNAYPSRFILILIALIYPEAAHYLFEKISKSVDTKTYIELYHYPEITPFHNDTLHASLRDWVTLWMTSSQTFLLQDESSVILQQKTMTLFQSPMRDIAHHVIARFFTFFLASKNLTIEPKKAQTYADFIISEYQNVISQFLQTADGDLKKSTEIESKDLFGI